MTCTKVIKESHQTLVTLDMENHRNKIFIALSAPQLWANPSGTTEKEQHPDTETKEPMWNDRVKCL